MYGYAFNSPTQNIDPVGAAPIGAAFRVMGAGIKLGKRLNEAAAIRRYSKGGDIATTTAASRRAPTLTLRRHLTMHGFSTDSYRWLAPGQLGAAIPPAWCTFQLALVLLVRDLPSTNEVKRRGKRLESLKTRWASLSPLCEAREPSVVQRFPGTRAQAIVATCPRLPPIFRTFASLLETPLGSWHDLQVFEQGTLVAFTVREEASVWVASGSSRVSLADAYGERSPLPMGLLEYLRS